MRYDSIRTTVQALFKQSGWSYYRLARESGLSDDTCKHYIQGKADVLSANADRMLAALREAS